MPPAPSDLQPCVSSALSWQFCPLTPTPDAPLQLAAMDDVDVLDLLRLRILRPMTPMHLPKFRSAAPGGDAPQPPQLDEVESPPPPPEAAQGLPGLTEWHLDPPAVRPPRVRHKWELELDHELALASMVLFGIICVLMALYHWL